MKNKILFIVSLLFGLMFINAGLNKFFNYMPLPDDLPESRRKAMGAMMQIIWVMPLIGVAEIVGGILFIPAKTRELAAIIVFPLMIGILLTHIFNAPSGLPIALVLLAIHIWVMVENRARYLPMIK